MSSSSNASLNSDLLVDFFDLATNFSKDFTFQRGLVSDVLTRFSEVIKTSDTIDFDSLFDSAIAVLNDIAPLQTFRPSTLGDVFSIPDNAAAFATIGTNGKRIDDGHNASVSPLKWTRSDGKSDGRGATVVTFAFDKDFGINGVSTDRAKALFAKALQTWANYAPLDFQEIEDPGSGSKVDILAESEAIDGPGKTLAFAYFPSVGDITFDADESWSESSFLETTVHELGHSLGLDHEDDTDAIMNSVLGNRFEGSDSFLFEDDINGIRNLYGTGKGSVKTLAGTPVTTPNPVEPDADQPALINLVKNGSFEDVPLENGESNVYSSISGWSVISGNGFQVDRRPELVGKAADGTAWVELDAYGANATIGQNIDTLTGETYNVSVDFSDGGRPESTTSVQVFWEGKAVDTLSGGGPGRWRRFDYEFTGGDRSVSTLAFRAVGPADNVGGFIDNVVVTAAKESLVEAESESLGTASQPTGSGDPISGDRNDLVASSALTTPFPTPAESFLS